MRPIFLPLAGGNLAERLLRNRGRARAMVARYCRDRLRDGYEALRADRWRPPEARRNTDIAISLTSWKPRLGDLPLVLVSLLQQTFKPAGIHVWLSESDVKLLAEQLGAEVKGLFESYGVRFRACADLKCHTKWLPMIESGHRDAFVICDDDIVYPRDWFEAIVTERRDDAYVAVRCHRMSWGADGMVTPYGAWAKQIVWDGRPSDAVFVTACGGALVHPERIRPEFLDREEIRSKCLRADDVWLKAAHQAAGVPCYKTRYSFPCLELPGTDASGLAQTNVDGDGNDRQIAQVGEFFRLRLKE